LSLNEKEKTETDVATRVNEGNKDYGGKLVPKKVLSGEEQQVTVTEENQSAFWTTMAPNVDDYGSSAARAIATGSGHVIRGIFWVRDSTVAQLESGTLYLQSKMNPLDKPSNISPRTLRNLKRVRDMSRATENVARSVLLGIVKTAGFFSGSLIKSRAGKKVFKLMPGEVALVSLDAFGKLFDAVEKATSDVLESTSLMTQNVIAHRYGESAGQVTQDTFATAGHVVATAWTVAKLRNALNPKAGARPLTKTGVIKGLAKKVVKGKQPTT
jgi:spartin